MDRHFDLVAHAHQQEPSLCAVYCCLSNQLIEALRVKLLADRADACLAGLAFLQFFVEFLLKNDDIESSRRDGRDILDPELATILILSRWENRIQIVLSFVGGRVT